MKSKLVFLTVLLAIALVSAACATQEATNAPGGVGAVPTQSTNGSTATDDAGEGQMTPTLSADNTTPVQEAGGTAVIPETGAGDVGAPDDLDELMTVLRETGATVELGDAVTHDFLSIPGQIIMINGEEVQIFAYDSAEQLEAQVSQLPDDNNPENEPQFYKLGTMLVRYVARDPGVRDLLEDVLGAEGVGR